MFGFLTAGISKNVLLSIVLLLLTLQVTTSLSYCTRYYFDKSSDKERLSLETKLTKENINLWYNEKKRTLAEIREKILQLREKEISALKDGNAKLAKEIYEQRIFHHEKLLEFLQKSQL